MDFIGLWSSVYKTEVVVGSNMSINIYVVQLWLDYVRVNHRAGEQNQNK